MTYIAFFSYAHTDNEYSSGKLVKFCKLLEQEVRILLGGSEFQIFLDRNVIEWGNHWRRCIAGGLEQSAVLIPVLSPTYLNRPECRKEFNAFVSKEQREFLSVSPSADDALILPLLFLSLPDGLVDDIADIAKERQWEKVEDLSIKGKKLETVANFALIRRLAHRLIEKRRHIRELSVEQIAASAIGLTSIEYLVRQLEFASAELVSWPTTMPTGHWLDRTELNDLILASNQPSSSHVLIGPPGVGKSALLARFARHCLTAGHVVLAIKSDFLPVAIDSPAALSERILGRNQDLGETVIRLAKHRKIVVIVDQLDALADLADLRSERLDILLNLIRQLRNQPNVTLVCSSRSFEMKHDLRLNALAAESDQPTMSVLELPPLSTEQVLVELEEAKQIKARNWPNRYLAFLAIPYHLRAFLEYLESMPINSMDVPEAGLFQSIHRIHEALWNSTILGYSDSATRQAMLTELARLISQTESLLQPISGFDSYSEVLNELTSAGWLYRVGLQLGFAHQTQYEFVLARRYARDPDEFLKHIGDHDGLFVRPLIWHTLNYIRTANPPAYTQTMERLLESGTRRHLRYLLYDFLAQVPTPSPEEVVWVTGILRDPSTYHLIAYRLWYHCGWYQALFPTVIPTLMGDPPEKAWPIVRILQRAWRFANQQNRDLLKKHWLNRREYLQHAWEVLSSAKDFDEELVSLLCSCIKGIDENEWALEHAISNVRKSHPVLALQLLGVGLNRRLDVASNQGESIDV